MNETYVSFVVPIQYNVCLSKQLLYNLMQGITYLSTVSSLASLSITPASDVDTIQQTTSSSNFILSCWLFLSFVVEDVLKSQRVKKASKSVLLY